jgi:hypothetical protein
LFRASLVLWLTLTLCMHSMVMQNVPLECCCCMILHSADVRHALLHPCAVAAGGVQGT